MAQIIKHRRGSIGSVKTTTARNAELIVASGSISNLTGPFVFIGSPTLSDEGVAGAHVAVSKIYAGAAAPAIATETYGSVLDGTPFYSTNDQALYILGNAGGGGNTNMDLTGNLEGRSVTKLTIDQLNGSVNVTGSVTVSQNISASGDISASNLELQGNANIKGNITLGGNINIGNQNSDLIVFGGEVSSSILPELDNEFNLGAPTQNWKDLHVSGTAYINQAKIANMEINGVIVFEDLIVSGNTYLGNDGADRINITGSLNTSGSQTLTGSLSQLGNYDLVGSQTITNNLTVSGSTFFGDTTSDKTTITGSLNVSGSSEITGAVGILGQTTLSSVNVTDLTDNRIVLAGANGELEDDANFTFDSTTFDIGQGDFKVDTSGNIRTSGSLLVQSTSELVGAVGINSTLDVTGSTLLKNTLEVVGAVGLNSTLDVTGSTHIKDLTQATNFNSAALVVDGGVGIGKDLWVSGSTTIAGNLTILGSATQVIISASTVEIDDNILRLNAYSPYQRYAGIEVMDSGSSNVSASLLWDSTNDYWLFTSASGETGKAITTTFGTQGTEVSLAINTVPKATGLNAIGNSLIVDNGTAFSYNTDALIVTGSSGQTYIKGMVTLANAGGTDLGTNSSAMMFRNSNYELGYISTTATTNVLTGILGYRESDGVLEFSSKIDGGFF
jgi:cytoskeletal protein CcmA (bactofilin family)